MMKSGVLHWPAWSTTPKTSCALSVFLVAQMQETIMDGNDDAQLCPHAGSENFFQSAVKSSKDASSNKSSNNRMSGQR